jgi:5'-3' exonuclease
VDEDGEEEAEPDLLTPQIPIIMDFFEAAGIPLVGVDDYEADDVIATLSHQEKGPTRIVTGDRDLFQLVDDERDVAVAYLAKGISNHDLVDISWISEKYGIPGERYALYAMIRGDASDGLPGIRGIGEKGAAVIAQKFQSMSDVIDAALSEHHELASTHRKKILEDLSYARIAEKLVTCALDVRLPKIDLKIPKSPQNRAYIDSMKKDYGLGASVDRLLAALQW